VNDTPAIVLTDRAGPTLLKVTAYRANGPAPEEPESRDAAGARTGEAHGKAPSAQAAAPSGASGASQQDQYGHSVHLRIKAHQHYSRPLVRNGLHGTVVLTFGITHRGHLHHPGVVETSGSRVLDRVALGQLKSAAPFPPPPNGRPRRFTIPLTYRTQR
jgi:protein TonB